jgi:spore germination protein GerM
VAVYLGHTNLDVCICNSPVERKIKRTTSVEKAAKLALEELIKGPTKEERAKGYRGCLPADGQIARYEEFYSAMMEEYQQTGGGISQFGRKFLNSEGKFMSWGDRIEVKGVRIEDGTAYTDFSKELYSYGGGSCFTEAIETSIVNTLKQFPEVEKVVILVEGRKAEIEP